MLKFFKIDWRTPLEPISWNWYFKGVLRGILMWIPFTFLALIIPILGWFLLPIVPIFPFIYPFFERKTIIDKQNKIKNI